MKRTIISLIFFLISLTSACFASEEFYQTDLFIAGQGGYHTYRIPALLTTREGVVLAFAEARKNSSADDGDIDMIMKRSLDNGATWSDPVMIWNEPGGVTVGNPVPVQDRDTGIVWLLLTRENSEVFALQSTDNGLTWSAPRNITASVKEPDWEWVATGPGHGIQMSNGRIIIPSDLTVGGRLEGTFHSYIIYSDDHGQSWTHGAVLPDNTDECTAAELDDGTLYLNMRNNYFKFKRAFAVSGDGGESFGKLRWDNELIEPICQGSVLRLSLESAQGKNRLLFSNPASRTRDHLTVKLSYDEARSWPVSRTIYEGLAGYSDLAVLPGNSIGLLYENGTEHYHDKITFARFNLAWLTKGKDRFIK